MRQIAPIMNIADIAINTSSSAFDFFFGFFDCSAVFKDFEVFKDSDDSEDSAVPADSETSEISKDSKNSAEVSAAFRRASASGSPDSLPLYRRFTLLLAFPLSRNPHYA
ncbi:hypothetical protein [Bifidobacterium pseudocatenulatum]|uniref:hypothetical protein n=2 Tax=Bifidobacterium pseudocatenulatum TaxID=28026 RepID=UPI00216B50C0|nr:hypothetical protein [Bifidobacterium pseudocatenulatum]